MRAGLLKKLSLLAFVVLSLSFRQDNGNGINFQNLGWNQVVKLSKSENKPIFIFASTPYCHLSRHMEPFLHDKTVGEYYNSHFICVKMDPSDFKTNFRLTNWGVSSVPTMLFMDMKRKIVHRADGFQDEHKLMEQAATAANIIKSEETASAANTMDR